ncbi:hypothetical protein HKCCE3408_15400 [Rhodobacterales bacterium HKCCE3408]|nr:hypothetical protein [Rhodobacterales bacterium HKCCE3408]
MVKVKAPGLSALFLNFSILMFFGAILVFAVPFRDFFVELEGEVQSEVAESAGRSLQMTTSRAMEREWQSLQAAAGLVDLSDADRTRDLANAILVASDAVAWVGVADRSGHVIAASSGQREGEDVSMHRWYREGIVRGTVGSVQTPSLSGQPDAAPGLINMSVPLVDEFGVSRGVLVYSIRIEWLVQYLGEAAEVLGVDFQLRDERGTVVAERLDHVGDDMPANLESLVSLGQEFFRVSRSGASSSSILAVFPEVLVGDAPQFGWALVVRVPAVSPVGDAFGFIGIFRTSVAVLFVLTFAASAVFAALVLHPIERLARDAKAISDGGDIYPVESFTTRESSKLSYALGAMQPILVPSRTRRS